MTAASSLNLLLVTLVRYAPTLLVFLVAMILAVARRHRHPAVSNVLLASLATMVFVMLVQTAVYMWIFNSGAAGGTSAATRGIYMSIAVLAVLPFRIGTWMGMICAVFGWRHAHADKGTSAQRPQFSIKALLAITTLAALLLGLGRVAIAAANLLPADLAVLLDDIPVILALLVGIWLGISRWPAHRKVSALAIAGFAMTLALLLTSQLLPLWLARSGQFSSIFQGVLFLLSPVPWIFILAAAFASRGSQAPVFANVRLAGK